MKIKPVRSAFQIRFAGYKGMLSVDKDLDDNPRGPQVVFRTSMRKFNSKSRNLEIVKYSQPSKNFLKFLSEFTKKIFSGLVSLNRPLIMILDQISAEPGKVLSKRKRANAPPPLDPIQIRNQVCGRIRELLDDQLFFMADMLMKEDESVAALSTRTPLHFEFDRLRESGFELTTEPFFREMLMAIHKNLISKRSLFF